MPLAALGGLAYGVSLVDFTSEPAEQAAQKLTANGKLPQATAEFIVTDKDRRYTIWDGMVVEEFTNSTPHVYSQGSLGKRAYDFDLRVITHMSDESSGDMEVTLFSDSAVNGKDSPHIEHVRKMGCLVADGYFDRAGTGAYEPPPANIAGFRARHCTPSGP